MTGELIWLSAAELADAIRLREISPVEAADAVLDRLAAVNPAINAFVTVLADEARQAARAAEHMVMTTPPGELPPLHGVPVTVKDLIDTAGVRTTYGSTLYRDHIPEQDHVTWARLKAAGAILIGKTTTPEFGMLGITESELTGITGNPWDPAMTPGGSSGGAAAAVAAGVAPLAWGSDGGGSIRVPAACCGVVGLKPSMGRVPNPGPGVWSGVTTVGPITRTVADAALMLDIAAGPHLHDPFSLPPAAPSAFAAAAAGPSLQGWRVAYLPHFGTGPVSSSVAGLVRQAAGFLTSDLGAAVEEMAIVLPDPLRYFHDYWMPQFALELGQMAGTEDALAQLHPAIASWRGAADAMSATEYCRVALTTRQEISDKFADVFETYDLIVCPTMPLTAFPHPGAAAGPLQIDGHSIAEPAIDFHRLTEPPSHAGLPALSLCCGFTADGLPAGLQIIGPPGGDALVIAAAAAYEAATPWHSHRPPLKNAQMSPAADPGS
jgi:Asp-tRNA(Asn)/Glu-tRNA(Gln) amidotransferase A subunit family amidase